MMNIEQLIAVELVVSGCANVADAKNLSWIAWFLAGLIAGPLALLAVVGMPNRGVVE